jgi:signal transduction histidine kinase
MMQDASIRSIRTRLFILLLRAFATVVLLTLLLVLILTVFFLVYPSRFNPLERTPIATRLETFYLVHGNWKDVKTILPPDPQSEGDRFWNDAMLVGPDGKVLVDHGRVDTPLVGAPYVPNRENLTLQLRVRGHDVGTLIFNPSFLPSQARLTLGALAPVGFVSIFLALLTIVIGLLLVRRVINPLSEVIAAARSVADGNLSTRVRVSGPDDLRALSDSFNHMADSLERDDRERRDMLADIAHELRTPLSVMRGRLEGIVDGVYPAAPDQIAPALEETYLLERLVEDLRLLTLAEMHQLPFEKKKVDLGELARHVLDLFQAEAQEKQITLSLERKSDDLNAVVDSQRTEQVLGNLVNNALHYVTQGGKVQVVLERTNGEVAVSVEDNGPGVPEENLQYIFHRFWREEKSRTRTSGGAGLGLAIAKQLVEGQGGNITAADRLGGGLQIKCTLPAA